MARIDSSSTELLDPVKGKGLDRLVFLAVRGLIAVVGRIPLTPACRICEAFSQLVYVFDRKHREIGLINLRIVFPDRDDRWRRRVLRASFRRIGDHFAELCRLPRVSAEEIRRRVEYEPGRGLENYEAARRQGNGVMFLTGHVGSWELLPLAHAVLGSPLSVVVRPLDNPFLDRWLTATRCRFGNQVIPKESSLRRILRLFNMGEDVGILIDQNVQEKDGVFVTLFEHQACTTASPAALALRTGAPVVIGFLIPAKQKGHYLIRFYPPIAVDPSEDRQTDLKEYTALFNGYLEEVIRENPDCWLWGHRRFRTQPDGWDPYEPR